MAHNKCVFDRIYFFLFKYGHISRRLLMKFWKNYIRTLCFWWSWRFFWQNMGMRAVHFLRIDVFLPNIDIKALIFKWIILNKSIPCLLLPLILCSFDRIYSFWTKHGHGNIGFLMKNLKQMTWEHRVFERMDVFSSKYWIQSSLLLRERTFFYKICKKSPCAYKWSQIKNIMEFSISLYS